MINGVILSLEEFASLPPEEVYARWMAAEKDKENLSRDNSNLRDMVCLLRHQRFGRKSERLVDNSKQPALPGFEQVFDEGLESTEEDTQSEEVETPEDASKEEVTTRKKGRRPLPKNLPRERVIHDLSEESKVCSCGHHLHKIGEETSEQLDYIPAQMRVIEHVRYKYGCRHCQEQIKVAPPPAQPIPKGLPTAGLLSHMLVSKYDDHLPLYRQSEIWQRLGIDIPRATMSNWVIKTGALLEPLVALLKKEILSCDYIRADETTAQVLKEAKRSPFSKSYMWVYMTGVSKKRSIVYEYQPTRQAEHPTNFLSGFQGYLQSDAYSGYDNITSQPGIVSVGCWAHSRRKFIDVVNLAPHKKGKAHEAVEKIRKLYEIERFAKEKELDPDRVKELRLAKAKPILDQLKPWLEDLAVKTLPKGQLAKAVNYTLRHWTQLTRYLEDGRLDIDNNACERAIRPFAIGRKNWLFMGNVAGAKAAAVIYSLIETAKANGLNPYGYLQHVLEVIPTLTPSDLTSLLPWNCPESSQNPTLEPLPIAA